MMLILKNLIKLSIVKKRLILIIIDSISIFFSVFLSFFLKYGIFSPTYGDSFWFIFIAPLIAFLVFFKFGFYNIVILRFIEFKGLLQILYSVSIYSLLWGLIVVFFSNYHSIPYTVILINWIMSLAVMVSIRLFGRWLLLEARVDPSILLPKNVLIYGAGSAGRGLLSSLKEAAEFNPIAFIDDDYKKHGKLVKDYTVFSKDDLSGLIENYKIDQVLIAIPSASRSRRNSIIKFLDEFSVQVRMLPGLTELIGGEVTVNDIREPNILDLLGRASVESNKLKEINNIENKVVFVSGAGGSIGSELCRQIILLKPKKIILFDISELALYNIESILINLKIDNVDIFPILGDVSNKERLKNIFKFFEVDTIYHAAAYKHVPLVELNNSEGILNNVFGTLSCAEAAIAMNVETFVLISTDKAVRPTNIMGASKRMAELIMSALTLTQEVTKFTMVRFGNVLDSSGSVIPLFNRQIKEGGPVTVTDKNMVRYFMTIPEAVELVIQAGEIGNRGDLLLLDMGEPVRIDDLAKKMIHLSGYDLRDKDNPNGDIEIKYTGLRLGEKLYEELLIEGDVSKTENPLIMCAKENMIPWVDLELILEDLKEASMANNSQNIRKILMKAIPEFNPNSEISDLLFKH